MLQGEKGRELDLFHGKMQQPELRDVSPELTQLANSVGRSRFCGFRDFADAVDNWITTSRFGRLFRLSGTGHVSGLTTCYRMAFIYQLPTDALYSTA